jgi:hypothetical protein
MQAKLGSKLPKTGAAQAKKLPELHDTDFW